MPRKTGRAVAGLEASPMASMRPRPDAAENGVHALDRRRVVEASMRPRPDAAENARRDTAHARSVRRFNEAAARCRGKPGRRERRPAVRRHGFNEAAARCRGKHPARGTFQQPRQGFNEAAARCRGKPARPSPSLPSGERSRFNEAAARCRGKRLHRVSDRMVALASMRPRPDAAENSKRRVPCGCPHTASMRPRPDAAENSAAATGRKWRG